MSEIERREWCCASIACRRGYLTRGQVTVLQGARRFVSPRVPQTTGTLVRPRIDARSVDAELTLLDPAGAVDVVLHWQQWRLRSPTLDRVREAVLAAAGRVLDQPDEFSR